MDCGSSDSLEVDHQDYRQKVDHKVWSWSADRRAKELAKCAVRCESCHAIKTASENRVRCRGAVASPVARLTAAKVFEIRARRASGESTESLAVEYGVDKSTIRRVVAGRTWGYL